MTRIPILWLRRSNMLVLTLAFTASARASDRWWDGTNTGGTGDGASAGGSANWDSSILNWDQGNGLSRVDWNDGAYDTAIFGGTTTSTVTLGGDITVGNLAVSGATYTLLGNRTLTLATAATPTGATPSISNSATLTLGGSGVATNIAGTEGLLKNGGGSLIFRGTAAYSLSGGIKIDAVANAPTSSNGRVEIDFSDMAHGSSNLLNSGNPLTIASGNFAIKGKNGGGNLSQVVNGFTLTGGLAGLWINHNSSTTTTLDLASIARNESAGLHVNVSSATGATIKTGTSHDATGILGPWATYQLNATNSVNTINHYATRNGSGNIVAYTGTAAANVGTGTGNLDVGNATANYDLGTFSGAMASAVAVNTIRYLGPLGTTTVTGNLIANGLLNAGSGEWSLNGGTITIGASKELVVNTANGNNIVIGSVVQNYGTGTTPETSALTITGYKQVTLSGASTYTGVTTINGTSAFEDGKHTTQITSLKDAGEESELGKGANLILNGAVIRTGASGSSDRIITITGTSGFYVKGAFTQTLTGSISGTGSLTTDGDYNSGAAGGTGNLVLAGDNSFTGDLRFLTDSRVTLGHVSALKNATLNMTGTRILADLTTHDLDYVIGGLKGGVGIDIGSGVVSIGNNHQSTTYTGLLSGAGSFKKTGGGALTLNPATPNTYGGGTVVESGILAVNGQALPDAGRLTILGGKVAPTAEELVDTLYFDDVRQAAGTWGASGSGADHIDDTRFIGTAGVIRVQPWAADPAVLDFARAAVGHAITLNAVITNLGTAPISGTAVTDGAPFSVVSASWSVQPSSTTTVQVVFSPTAASSFPGTLTLTGGSLTRTVQLTGVGVPVSTPLPAQFRVYQHPIMQGMPAPATAANLTLAEGGSATQGFTPRRDDFLTGYAALDAAAPAECRLASVSIRTESYTNSPSTLRFEVLRVENDSRRTLLYSEELQKSLFGTTTYLFAFTTPPTLTYDQAHELKVTVVTAGNPSYGGPKTVTLFRSAGDYADGSLNTTGDLWCDLQGYASLPVFAGYSAAAGAGSRFSLDVDPANADSSDYSALPGKLLGIAGEMEPVVFTHPVEWGPLSFEIDSSGVATGSVTSTTGTSNTFSLAGLAEGRRMLWVRAGGTVVGWMKLQVYPRRSMRLAYTYVQYPGESEHSLKSANAAVTTYISGVYDKANVGIVWTDNGTITHEWDLDGDGQSHEDDYSEVHSPINSGAIPNQLSVFSNVYMLRYDKIDETVRGGGGGTSRGLAEIPPPANLAMVRCTLNRDAASHGSTLSHEIGHNLGLWHTNVTNNLMDVGRLQDNLWSWQWDIIHNTIAQLPTVVPNPDENSNGLPDAWEDHWFGNHDAGENPADGDPDFDGLANLIEFATGTNPTVSNPSPVTQAFETDGGEQYLQLTVPRNPAASNYNFVGEFSSNFLSWTPGIVIANSPVFIARDTVPASSAPARRFGRLSVSSN